ncbi:hypothetical protein [Trebonia sp.]|uniref:hypothetical protein n=1 Tax=Trebonia sp. TaxID=2767075 RepID=UPI002624D4EB|nr:hypothetical protein [Trebonia sp.]
MSVDATAGAVSPGAAGADVIAGSDVQSRDTVGLLFARISVLPALGAMAWLLGGFVLLLAGWFRPVPVLVLSVLIAIPVLFYGLRAVPGLAGSTAPALPLSDGGRAEARRDGSSGKARAGTPWWTVAATAVIVAAFAADQLAYHSQFVMVLRDPGSYYQFATWIAGHGSLPIPQDAAAFGGTHGGAVTFASYAYYQVGNTVQPQFMAGLPMVLAGAMWLGGANAALLVSPVLGALALLTFGGLAARLVGARWAVLAVLAAAVTLPQVFTSRSSYSEPLAEILFLGGLALVLDSLRDRENGGLLAGVAGGSVVGGARWVRTATWASAALGGLAFGLTVLVRIDGASDILLAIPFCGALFVLRKPQALPLTAGFAVGVAFGAVDAVVFAWQYMMTNESSVKPLVEITIVLVIVTVGVTLYIRRRGLPRWDRKPGLVRLWGWLANASVVLAFVVIAVFALRPHLQHTYGATASGVVKASHAELSLHWVWWYIGIPAVLLGTLGAGLLIRKCLRGQAPDWILPLMVLVWSIVTFLYRPAITPDQPWASRRLVPAVIPGFILFATWALAWAVRWIRRYVERDAPAELGAGVAAVVLAIGAVAIVAPAVWTTWGPRISTSGGIRLTFDGLGDARTYGGELDAMQYLCTELPPNATVVIVNEGAVDHLMQSIRGMCGVPVGGMLTASPTVVKAVVSDISATGRTPVILGGSSSDLRPYADAGVVRQVMKLNSTKDPGTLYYPPRHPVPYRVDLWAWEPASAAH